MRRRPTYILLSLVILIPCFWHERIQAGDLGSHLYNAWLAQLVDAGRAPGLIAVSQHTNVLFDYLLKWLLNAFGANIAQHVAVPLAVLVFVWGAFAFVSRISQRQPWHLLPVIAMLAYGWVFRMGLFNFYISLGLCFWLMWLVWDEQPRHLAMAIPIAALAFIAHGLPVMWTLALLAYRWISARLNPRQRIGMLAAGLAAIVVARVVLQSMWKTLWFSTQFTALVAIDQLWTYDGKYVLAAVGLLVCWGLLLAGWIRAKGPLAVLSGIPFQICALTAVGIVVIPDWIRIPGYNHALVFLAERMSLALGVCICALTGAAAVRKPVRVALPVIALMFFAFSYKDEGALNELEGRMETLVARLPAGQRVVTGVMDLSVATNPTTHMIDRICLGRCYSYGNYEPSSGQFRIRVAGVSPLVVSRDADANGLQNGTYVVQARDLPLYEVVADPNGRLGIRELQAGQHSDITPWNW
ncbi:MAG TPA: hypothetical protein VG456_04515 [Candidatus Sulfopaludibacter sp.]|nr:hypothetical protein [Candidatus Sulfopaludibacter sp.]